MFIAGVATPYKANVWAKLACILTCKNFITFSLLLMEWFHNKITMCSFEWLNASLPSFYDTKGSLLPSFVRNKMVSVSECSLMGQNIIPDNCMAKSQWVVHIPITVQYHLTVMYVSSQCLIWKGIFYHSLNKHALLLFPVSTTSDVYQCTKCSWLNGIFMGNCTCYQE